MAGVQEASGVAPELLQSPEVCEASIDATRNITHQFLGEFERPDSIIYDVIADRAARMPDEERLGLVPGFLLDPSKSGVVVARWEQQEGKLPDYATADDPDRMVVLWAAASGSIPPLTVPEGGGPKVMNFADRLGMRGAEPIIENGGQPVIFERSEVERMPVGPNTLLNVAAGAKGAGRERIRTAKAIVEAHDFQNPIVATTKPERFLMPEEREAVAGFAPSATNEFELFVASVVAEGFTPHESNAYGSRFLPDGSSYIRMKDADGVELIVLAPKVQYQDDGSEQSGVFNAYKTLSEHGALIDGIQDGADFTLQGKDVIQVTSTHYGPPAVLNNLLAVHDLAMTVGSFYVAGDNQPARTERAHLIEQSRTLGQLDRALQIPPIKQQLLGETSF